MQNRTRALLKSSTSYTAWYDSQQEEDSKFTLATYIFQTTPRDTHDFSRSWGKD